MAESVETAVYRLRVEGQDQIDRLTKSIGDLTVAEEKATASTRKTEQALQNQIARIDPVIRAQEQYKKALQSVASYRESGVGTEQQLSALQEGATRRYQQQVAAIQQVEKATVSHTNAQKLQGYQMLNLSRQIQDVGVSLFGGASPIMVAAQQLPQIFDISQQSGVSMTNMFKQAGTAALGFLTPVRMVVGGVVALTAAVAALALQWEKTQRTAERGLIGAAAKTGTTVEDVNRFTRENRSAFGLSEPQARGAGETLAQAGIIISKTQGMGEAIQGFATLTNQSISDVIKQFGKLAEDPVKAMDELAKTYGPVGSETRKLVQDFVTAGDKTGAWQTVINNLADANKDAIATIDPLSNAIKAASNALNTSFTGDPENRIERVSKALEVAKQRLEALQVVGGGGEAVGIDTTGIEKAQQAVIDLQNILDRFKTTTATAQLKDVQDKAEEATKALIPQIAQIKNLTTEIEALEQAKKRGALSPQGGAALTVGKGMKQDAEESLAAQVRITEETDKTAAAHQGVSRAVAMQLDILEKQTALAGAVGDAEKQAAQYALDYAEAKQRGLTASEANAIATEKQAAAQAKNNAAAAATTANVLKQVEALKDSTSMIEAQTADLGTGRHEMEALTASSIAYKNAIASGADEAAAAALSAATMANYTAKAANEARQLQVQWEATARAARWAAYVSYNYSISDASKYRTTTWNATEWGQPTGVTALTPIGEGLQRAAKSLEQQAANAVSFSDQVAAAGAGGVQAALTFAMGAQAHGAITGQAGGMTPGGSIMGQGPPIQLAPALAESEIIGQVGNLYDLLKQQTPDKAAQAANMQREMAWLQSRPQSIEQQRAIAGLQQSIDQLTQSTDSLNATNQELLSPYYTQDPRTSHIGFRSQGMALGGYVDVPGGVSSNDNMIATIPVASGERIFVDPMGSRRTAIGPGHTTINISQPILIQGNANKDELGRTLFQSNQGLAKQIGAATAR